MIPAFYSIIFHLSILIEFCRNYLFHMFSPDSLFLLFYNLVSVCPSFGGSNPGLRAEIIRSVKEKLSLICGCAFTMHPSAFASVSVSCFLRQYKLWLVIYTI